MKQAETCLKRRLDDYKLIVTKMQQKLTTLALAAVDCIFLPQAEQLSPFTSHFMACITMYNWLVVWNMWIIFHSVGNFIIPTDELHHFSEG